jgi:hypothetical protein
VDHDDAALGRGGANDAHAKRRAVLALDAALRFRAVHRWSVFCAGAALAAAVLAGCTPHRHAAVFYEKDPAELRALEERARERCAAARTDGRLPPYAFTTDGCSAWPDGDWGACCVEHDAAYWCGGSAEARAAADAGLRSCLARLDHPWMGNLMHFGVRIGGHPWLPFPWRWGYGWDWPYRHPAAPKPGP